MKNLLLILFVTLFTNISYAKTEAQCLKQLAKDTNRTEKQIATYLTICSVKLMEGFQMYLGGQDERVRSLYKRLDDDGTISADQKGMTVYEQVEGLQMYNECEEISHNLKVYLERCEANKL